MKFLFINNDCNWKPSKRWIEVHDAANVKAATDFAQDAQQALTKVQSKKTRKRKRKGTADGGANKRVKKEDS